MQDVKDYEWACRVNIPSEVIEYGIRRRITYRTQTEDATVTIVLSNGHVWRGSVREPVMIRVDALQYEEQGVGF